MFLFLYGFAFLMGGCASEDSFIDSEEEAFINLQIKASSSGINEDIHQGEDRVTELRMLAFDLTGGIVYNSILNFPDGFNNSCEAVKFNPGVYDFYFFANESVHPDFAFTLASVTDILQLQEDPHFTQIQYNPDFQPDTYTADGHFLMSAYYNDVSVIQGGTKINPNPLILPTSGVELIRALAKIEIVFRKKTPGIIIPDEHKIASVQLQKVAEIYSVPPLDSFYNGPVGESNTVVPENFNYDNDSIGSVLFYIPEFLNKDGGTDFTELHINNRIFPIWTDNARTGLISQRRTIASLSGYSIVRNYYYIINAYIDAAGGVYIKTGVTPWNKASYIYMFQDPDRDIVIPPVIPTDSSVIVPTVCGKVEIHSTNEYLQQGLQSAYGDIINWWDPNTQGPNIIKGRPPYYCEKKYGIGWRLINSCEMMSFLTLFDQTYRIWQSNTWQGINAGLPYYSLSFRQEAQDLLGKLTGADMSKYNLTEIQGGDNVGGEKLGMLDNFFTPGDVVVALKDYPEGWPYPVPPYQGIENWFPMEVVHQLKAYWYTGYLDYSDPDNYDKVLYQQFQRYNFSSTVTRCVRSVE
ncbi:MAG: FimB/Mfa2 family fimbrial subunit [Prevotella sp.]|nr:FimB/Mfa2 family fimbrial subunit [Prevotella sp.]MDR2001487.1 FimB/Mfa2 family fimbrial subunit [Prevotella sp.]